MFGKVRETPQTEMTPFYPRSPYGVGEGLRALHHGELSRELRPVCLFGHSVQSRVAAARLEFVTRKVTRRRRAHQARACDELSLGNLDANRDWGFAGDYVRAMWMMLQQDKPDDYVIATGVAHSVRDLVETAFGHAGLDWQRHVRLDPALLRPAEVEHLIGDATKARTKLGWVPEVDFSRLVKMMVDEDLARLSRHAAPLTTPPRA